MARLCLLCTALLGGAVAQASNATAPPAQPPIVPVTPSPTPLPPPPFAPPALEPLEVPDVTLPSDAAPPPGAAPPPEAAPIVWPAHASDRAGAHESGRWRHAKHRGGRGEPDEAAHPAKELWEYIENTGYIYI